MNTKELLNIDWLSVNYFVESSPLSTGNEYHSNSLRFIPEAYGTRQFRYIYYIYVDCGNEPIASLVCSPLSKILDVRLHQVKLSNWVLYSDMAQTYLQWIKQDLNAKFISLSRLDLCVDMVGFDFYGFIKKYHDNKLREKKPKEVTEHYKKYDNESIYTGISWGSKLSDWTAKIYDKIREINEVSGKQYILDYFKANGIDVDKDKVWRYEFSITSLKDKYRLEDKYTIDDIALNDENIFQFEVQQYILRYYLKLHAFAYNTGKVRFIDEKQYHILNLLSQEIPPQRVRSSRTKRKDYSAKVSINLGMQQLKNQTTIEAFITYKNILEVAKDYDLLQWLMKKHGKELKDIFIEKSLIMYGAGIKEITQVDLFESKEVIKR